MRVLWVAVGVACAAAAAAGVWIYKFGIPIKHR
jgi:hypothetical protein